MKAFYKLFSLTLLVVLSYSSLTAQVKDISYTLAPGANYTWFNNRAGLNQAFMVGGRLGIGFGEYLELRGMYYQTIDAKLDFGGFDIETENFDNTNIDLARYGAELKFNIGRGKFLPYLLFGGGVQNVGRTGFENAKNIFGTTGLGLTLAASDRFVFSLEGQYLAYRFNAVRNLLDQAERDLEGVDLEDFSADQLGNWTVGANVAFYLGGRKPGELSAIDQAYLNSFGNGIKGLRFSLEPTVSRVNFDENLNYADAWFGGLNAGIDLGPFIGLRGYYLQAMDDGKLGLDFDKLTMYGADLRLNLSRTGLGFTPYLTLGAGRFNVQDDYVGRDDLDATSQGFASGGIGLSMQIAKTIRLNGAYKAILTSTEEFGDIGNTDQLTTSNSFVIGLAFGFGNSPDPGKTVEDMMEDSLSNQADYYTTELNQQEQEYSAELEAKRKENARQVRELKTKYETRVAELESELNRAYQEEDTEKAKEIKRQKDEAEAVVAELKVREQRDRISILDPDYATDFSIEQPNYRGQPTPYGTPLSTNILDDPAPQRPANNETDQQTMSITFDQIIQLVRAANPPNATYLQNAAPQDHREVYEQEEIVDGQSDKNIREMRTRTTQVDRLENENERLTKKMAELRQEVQNLRDRSRDNQDKAGEDRYNIMLQGLDRIKSNAFDQEDYEDIELLHEEKADDMNGQKTDNQSDKGTTGKQSKKSIDKTKANATPKAAKKSVSPTKVPKVPFRKDGSGK